MQKITKQLRYILILANIVFISWIVRNAIADNGIQSMVQTIAQLVLILVLLANAILFIYDMKHAS